MLSLQDFLFEGNQDLSDNEIYYTLGKYRISWGTNKRREALAKKYDIKKSDPRPGIIRWMKEDTAPLMKDTDEVIHRKDWDLQGITGETEKQIMHKSYYELANYVIQHHKPKHDILTVFQCSSKKPYSENRLLKYDYFTVFDDYTDFASVSNPGTVPIEFCSYYPYRYDEWNIIWEQSIKDFVDLDRKDEVVNVCRFLRFQRAMKYKHVLVVIGNPNEQTLFDQMYKHNIEGAKDWLHIITDDDFRNRLSKKPKYATLFDQPGLVETRIPGLPATRMSYARMLKKCLADSEKDDFDKMLKDYKERVGKNKPVKESQEEWTMMKDISMDEIFSSFKKYTETNKGFTNNDKPILYRKYYFSVLDILLVALKGRLLEDIDGAYWKLMDSLKKNSDFEELEKDSFIFAYKPLCEKDKIKSKDMVDEAYKLKIVSKEKNYELRDNVLNCFK